MKRLLLLSLVLGSTALHAENPFWKEGATGQRHQITVYRSASCGCCSGWIEHLKEHNFDVKDVTVNDVTPFKRQHDIPPQAASCHTAIVDGLAIEGHVPAQDIKRALSEKSDIRLLTVPGMPSGTPGMDTPGAKKDNFNVYAVTTENKAGIYNSYENY